MRNDTHTIQCFDGSHEVKLDIFRMDHVEAIDVYDQPADLYSSGGWRIEGFINGTPAGTQFYSGLLGSHFWGQDDSRDVALDFIADARRDGRLPPVTV